MANEFKIGDVVRLKSGGPQMTVVAIVNSNEKLIRCQWFGEEKGSQKVEMSVFPPAALVLEDDV